jgi:hypothetical protein
VGWWFGEEVRIFYMCVGRNVSQCFGRSKVGSVAGGQTGQARICFIGLAPLYLYHFPCAASLVAMMMEAVQASGISVSLYQSTQQYNPEDSHLHVRKMIGIT